MAMKRSDPPEDEERSDSKVPPGPGDGSGLELSALSVAAGEPGGAGLPGEPGPPLGEGVRAITS